MPNFIIGIKVRVGSLYGKGLEPLRITLQAAEIVQNKKQIKHFPIMCHIDFPPPSRKEILELLRPGDILTHSFRPLPLNNSQQENQEIFDAMMEARKKGVFWDIGHGGGSLSFEVARFWLNQNQYPDFISSDAHLLSVDGPAYNNLNVMNKFLALGMPLYDVIQAVTKNPFVNIFENNKIDFENMAIKVGNQANFVIFKIKKGQFEYEDCTGEGKGGKGQIINGNYRLELQNIFLKGQQWL